MPNEARGIEQDREKDIMRVVVQGEPLAIPLWVRVGWLAFVAIQVPVYWVYYGPSNFLWFCDTANFILVYGMLRPSRLLFSSQAVGVLIIQLVWCSDFLVALLAGFHPIGGTEYMFDASLHPALRAMSLFHFAVPAFLIWALWRFGYDRRAWRLEAPILWLSIVPSFLLGDELNLNWVWKPFGFDPGLPAYLWVPVVLLLYPLVILGVSHLVLRSVFREPRAVTRGQ